MFNPTVEPTVIPITGVHPRAGRSTPVIIITRGNDVAPSAEALVDLFFKLTSD